MFYNQPDTYLHSTPDPPIPLLMLDLLLLFLLFNNLNHFLKRGEVSFLVFDGKFKLRSRRPHDARRQTYEGGMERRRKCYEWLLLLLLLMQLLLILRGRRVTANGINRFSPGRLRHDDHLKIS